LKVFSNYGAVLKKYSWPIIYFPYFTSLEKFNDNMLTSSIR